MIIEALALCITLLHEDDVNIFSTYILFFENRPSAPCLNSQKLKLPV